MIKDIHIVSKEYRESLDSKVALCGMDKNLLVHYWTDSDILVGGAYTPCVECYCVLLQEEL